tara:strand:- start:19 stop:159 length:141 start_codon:yes stop_codon:yes gene_type:complete
MGNLIAIANYIGLNIIGPAAPAEQDIVTELSAQIITENTSQNMITE